MADLRELHDIPPDLFEMFVKLSEAQLRHYYEPDLGLFVAQSALVVGRALDAGYEAVAMITERRTATVQDAEVIARCGDIPVYVEDEPELGRILGFKLVRGCMCMMRRRPLPDVAMLCKDARRIAVLENVTNPTNVGAIIRSAAALHIDAVLLTESCSDPLYRRACRVSMGTVFQIPWGYLPGEGPVDLAYLREMGFATAAMALREDSVPIDDPALLREDKLAIVLGSEGYGLDDHTIEDADYTVLIPMSPGVDSLNVAAASAVAFWQITR